ncbi:hypothetical protein GPECTOR_32g503 [Gonium pectorale]|uniref:Helix-turn-helix domain-containing protein n=1 Tax=Gonium pectorale TaxID=33097 RepID=A0A150GEX1_GONPE|nr:hypothetical protein GPECTOR_32g503 [Gonium pectorale]|eukprot:KXZ47890.1 hypothetical protein GPECTOR_32g503 [Gonium pectorale]
MHKQPPSMRYLACSHRCPSSDIGDVCTAIFRLLCTTYEQAWRQTFPNFEPWFCLSSAAVINMVHAYNARGWPATSDPASGYHAGNAAAICVRTIDPLPDSANQQPTHTATFVKRRPAVKYRQHQERIHCRYFTADDFTTLFSSLVQSTFIQFGPALVRQLKGIPMGISPAPFIANLYLASFEFRFLQQYPSATAAAQATLRRFRHSKRYLDDLASLNNPYLACLLYNDRQHQGLHGIYPSCLRVTTQSHPHLPAGSLPFLDILLVPTNRHGVSHITTRLYDKRDQPAFQNVRLSRFVPLHSNVNEAAKRKIFTGQFHRLRRIISDMDNFCYEIARVMLALLHNGYQRHHLETSYRSLLRAFPHLFYFERRAYNLRTPRPRGPDGERRPRAAPPATDLPFDRTVRYVGQLVERRPPPRSA